MLAIHTRLMLIHSAHPQSQQVVIINLSSVVFSKYSKRSLLKIIIATGVTVGLVEGIIDDTHFLCKPLLLLDS